MIFYFSGTGNSKWAAQQLGDALDEPLTDMARVRPEETERFAVPAGQRLGIVFPVYAWAMPELVENFIKRLSYEKGTYCFAVCTCGSEAGLAAEKLAKLLPLDSAWSLEMPNNYVVHSRLDDELSAMVTIRKAQLKLAKISASIIAEEHVFAVAKGSIPFLKSHVAAWGFNKFGRSARPFYATEACIGCGLCQTVCPVRAVTLIDGRPKWESTCAQCMGCINRCPVQAIQYGKGTLTRGRYYFNEASSAK